tara:strand:- start:469 stop:1521 length:1053 start_codon:yes stop_codon:yes gene_type:complete
VLHDPQSAHRLQSRSRAYAITHSSRRLLERLGLWSSLKPSLTGFESLELRDIASSGSVRFTRNDLDPINSDQGTIGWILDHRPLMHLLLQRLHNHANVRVFLGSPPPEAPAEALVVAADGPGSPTRRQWRIPVWQHRYRQGCLTSKVALRGADDATAFELFRPEGPMAVLPLGKGTAQVVWSAPLQRCEQRAGLSGTAFLDQLAAVLPQGLEPDLLLDTPRAFPQQWQLARRFSRGRGVLIGEAAHRCHPVGGQGLNLCWRDVETLMSVADPNLDAEVIARRYGRRRWLDVIAVGLATDLLVRLFSNRLPPLCLFRRITLIVMARMQLLRRLSLRAMTDGPMQLLRPLPE